MKTLRQVCVAAILTLALAVSVFAGDIDCPGAPSPTQTSATTSITTSIILTIVSLI